VLRPLWFAVAAIFLFEAWLWRRLAPVVAALFDAIALPAVKARLRRWLEQLPPAATLAAFLLPVALVLPLKVLGVWLLARGAWVGALAVLAVAKVVSVGVTAFVFQVTRPKLVQLAWFRWLEGQVLRALAWARRQLDPARRRLRALVRAGRSPLLRRLLRLRRRAHRS